MKIYTKKYELLSAYVDNELSDGEIKKLEDELKFSKDLQEKLNDLKRVKQLTSSSVKSISENPYFETRLFATLRNDGPWFFRLRKFYPVAGIIALSVVLMVVLKSNPGFINNIVEKQKSTITDYYKQNLKPLLFAADLTNDDIFNFAFYHRLPLDNRKHQYLYLGSGPKGNRFFEIKNVNQLSGGNNLEKFVKGLNLSAVQKHQVDSILSNYADDLQSQVLVNEKNTVAINPNIWNYNKALVADLVSFAATANQQEMRRVLPAGFDSYYNNGSVARLVSEVKSANNNKYIFITPDTIFSDSFYFDKNKFKREMKRLKEGMKKMDKKSDSFSFNFHIDSNFVNNNNIPSYNGEFKIFVNGNSYLIHLPKIIIPQIQYPDLDSMAANLGKAGDLFKSFSFNFPGMNKGKNFNYKYFYNDSTKGYKFNFRAFGFDTTFNFKSHKLDSMYGKNFRKFNFNNPDSLESFYKSFFGDSTAFNQKEIEKELQQVQKQMELFQKQMEKLQKQFPKDQKNGKSSKSIEI
ncbi:MAG: anti-sigma factor family protein [Ignavibacteriaceae bacterium]